MPDGYAQSETGDYELVSPYVMAAYRKLVEYIQDDDMYAASRLVDVMAEIGMV